MKLNEVIRVMVRKMKPTTTFDLLEILETLGEKCQKEKQ